MANYYGIERFDDLNLVGCPYNGRRYIELTGVILDNAGLPIAGIPVVLTHNGQIIRTETNNCGRYTFRVRRRLRVEITPTIPDGVTITPQSHTVMSERSRCDLNFILSSENTGPEPEVFTLSGSVFGITADPLPGFLLAVTVNGESFNITTNGYGMYSLTVPRGSDVIITRGDIVGVLLRPERYTFEYVQRNYENLDFEVSPIVPLSNQTVFRNK